MKLAFGELKGIQSILMEVHIPGYKLNLRPMSRGACLQISQTVTCVVTGTKGEQVGRKWYISSHATAGEIVQTALMAVLAFSEHEIRETFTYKGVPVFCPHFNLDKIVDLIQTDDYIEKRD